MALRTLGGSRAGECVRGIAAGDLRFWSKRISAAHPMLGGPEWLRERAASLQGLA